MVELGTFEDARRQVLSNVQRQLAGLRRVLAEPVETVEAAALLLGSLRRQAHEHLNQIQHEQLIVAAAEWLAAHGVGSADTVWHWNPRSRSDHAGPDLMGSECGVVRVCAEVNALEEPVGVIDAQMRRALAKLASLDGRRFYFVRTTSMKRRAVTKVVKAGWDVAVVQVSSQASLPLPLLTPTLRARAVVGSGA
jgi:hypothetical protein